MPSEQINQWFDEEYDTIEDFAQDCGVDAEAALEHIATNRRRCKSKTRNKFIVWALKQVAKQPDFHVVAGIVRKFDLDVQNFLDKVKQGSSRYKDFPEYIKNNGNFLVNMGTRDDGSAIVWTIPEQYWDFVHKIYPVSLKPRPEGGYFIAKKIKGTIVPVHRLIFPVETNDTVQSNSLFEDYLDWSSLYVKNFNCSHIYEGKRTNEYLSDHFKSGQRLSLQNRPTEVAVQD